MTRTVGSLGAADLGAHVHIDKDTSGILESAAHILANKEVAVGAEPVIVKRSMVRLRNGDTWKVVFPPHDTPVIVTPQDHQW